MLNAFAHDAKVAYFRYDFLVNKIYLCVKDLHDIPIKVTYRKDLGEDFFLIKIPDSGKQ